MRPLLGILGAIIAVLGLFMAGGAHEGGMYFAGMAFFLFGVALNFWLIGTAEPKRHGVPAVPAE